MPKICVDVSSEHTPIHVPFRDNIFNQEDNLTNTIAASEDFDHFPQTADSRIHHSAATTVTALLNLGPLSGTKKLVRDDEFVPSSFSSAGKTERGNDFVAIVEEEEKEIEIGRTRNISMICWNGKLSQPFKEKLQLRKII